MIERLQRYVLQDHKARWRNDLTSMAIATVWYLISLASGIERAYAFRVSMGVLAAATLVFMVAYVILPPKREGSLFDTGTSKRVLMPQLAFTCLALVLVRFGTPAAEAAILNSRLLKTFHGEPSRETIEAAADIVDQAREHNLKASPLLISRLGTQVLGSAAQPALQETALKAASAFASYRSNLLPFPKVQYQSSSMVSGAVKSRVACAASSGPTFRVELKGVNEPETASSETPIFSRFGGLARMELPGCSRAIIEFVDQDPPIPMSSMHARNVTFSGSTFYYDGGPLKLESVEFNRCNFRVAPGAAGNQNVERLLAAVMKGQPVTLQNFTFAGK